MACYKISHKHSILIVNLMNSLNSKQQNTSGGNTSELLAAAENLERENQKLKQDRERLIREFEEERNELQDQVASLQEENTKYLDTIIKQSKENA